MTTENNVILTTEETPLLEQFMARTRIDVDAKSQQSRDMVFDTVQTHLRGDVLDTHMLFVSNMADGSVKLDHIHIDQQKDTMNMNLYQVSNASESYNRLSEQLNTAVEAVETGNWLVLK